MAGARRKRPKCVTEIDGLGEVDVCVLENIGERGWLGHHGKARPRTAYRGDNSRGVALKQHHFARRQLAESTGSGLEHEGAAIG